MTSDKRKGDVSKIAVVKILALPKFVPPGPNFCKLVDLTRKVRKCNSQQLKIDIKAQKSTNFWVKILLGKI